MDVLIGRLLAYCVHPATAWRMVSGKGRAAILSVYAAAGYMAVLAALMLR